MTIRIYERTCMQNFTLGSVAADSTGGGTLDFKATAGENIFNGVLRGVSVACDSTNFSLSLRTKLNALENTVDEIYRATEISKYRSDDALYQGWVNGDSPLSPNLYATIINSGESETGIITVKIVTDINKKYSRN